MNQRRKKLNRRRRNRKRARKLRRSRIKAYIVGYDCGAGKSDTVKATFIQDGDALRRYFNIDENEMPDDAFNDTMEKLKAEFRKVGEQRDYSKVIRGFNTVARVRQQVFAIPPVRFGIRDKELLRVWQRVEDRLARMTLLTPAEFRRVSLPYTGMIIDEPKEEG